MDVRRRSNEQLTANCLGAGLALRPAPEKVRDVPRQAGFSQSSQQRSNLYIWPHSLDIDPEFRSLWRNADQREISRVRQVELNAGPSLQGWLAIPVRNEAKRPGRFAGILGKDRPKHRPRICPPKAIFFKMKARRPARLVLR